MNTPKYLEIAELLRIDIFVKHAKENHSFACFCF